MSDTPRTWPFSNFRAWLVARVRRTMGKTRRPKLATHVAAILPLVALVEGCTLMPSEKTQAVYEYEIPKSHIDAFVKASNGFLYLRLEPEGQRFWLILDEFADRKQRQRKAVVVSSITDGISRQVEEIPTEVGTVYCKQTPKFSCGLQLVDGAHNWSLVFHREDIAEIGQVYASARTAIQKYRGE